MKLPTGAGTPAPDPAAFQDATAACRTVSSITGEIGISGSVEGRRLRARVLAGLASPESVRLEAVAPFGQPFFIFVARSGNATLLLPRDGRVLERGSPQAVLEAIAAVPLDAAALREALTGCTDLSETGTVRALNEDWRMVSAGTREVYLHRESRQAPWRLVAIIHHEPGRPAWRSEYREFTVGPSGNLPRAIRFKSTDSDRFDLRLTLSQVEVNVTLEPGVFEVRVPSGARSITLDELKATGPLGNGSDDR
jgi:hypothetical protein